MTRFHENLKDSDRSILSGPEELLQAIGHDSIQRPLDAGAQVFNHAQKRNDQRTQLFDEPAKTGWASTGQLLGSVITYAAMAVLAKKATPFLKESSAITQAFRAGTAGALDEALSPVEDNAGSFATAKRNQLTTGFGTFSTISGASHILDQTAIFGRIGVRSLAGSLMAETSSGALGGLANAEITSITEETRVATVKELYDGASEYARYGLTFGVAGHYFGRGRPDLLDPRPKAALERISTEAFVSNPATVLPDTGHPIYNWIAEKNPSLRPKNYQSDAVYPIANQHSLSDWEPTQRPAVIRELRRVARTNLADDHNLDSFLDTLAETSWAKQARTTHADHTIARKDGQTSPTMPIFDSETSALEQLGLSVAFDSMSRQRQLGRLNFSVLGNEAKGLEASYGQRFLSLSQTHLESGLTVKSGSILFHEFLHHERGDGLLADNTWKLASSPFRDSPRRHFDEASRSVKQLEEATSILSLVNERGGVRPAVNQLTDVDYVFRNSHDLPKETRKQLKAINWSQGDVNEAALAQRLRPIITSLQDRYEKAANNHLRGYLFSPSERQASAVQALAKLRASVIGLPE